MTPIIDKIAWLHLRDGRLLSTRSHGKDRYYLPGGKREAGETDAQALLRKIREELAVVREMLCQAYPGCLKSCEIAPQVKAQTF